LWSSLINNRDIKDYSTVDIWIRKVCGSKETDMTQNTYVQKHSVKHQYMLIEYEHEAR